MLHRKKKNKKCMFMADFNLYVYVYKFVHLYFCSTARTVLFSMTLDNPCGDGVVTQGDAVELMHVDVHVVYCCLCLEQEMRISE